MLARASESFALERAERVVTYTEDYARHTGPLADRLEKVSWILPPVPDPPRTGRGADEIRLRYGIRARPVILFLGRFAEEKGLPVLLTAFELVRRRFPQAVLLLAGATQVPGETVWERVAPLAADPASGVLAPGIVPPAEVSDLFAVSDVLALPSINATESFGLVQVEAMLSGVPVVASELPGVRQPVRLTGMGEIARIGDAGDLARRLIAVLEAPERYRKDRAGIRAAFPPEKTLDFYETLYRGVAGGPR
jgi:glycosyltransferase involved in cell wall biosynthesis